MAGEPNPRRFAIWAALLLLPVVAGALLLPRLLRGGAPGAVLGAGAARPQLSAGAVAAGVDALSGAGPGPAGAAAPRPDGPTTEQIEASRAAEEELARAQRGWRKVEFMAPREGAATPEGERVVKFQGFGLSIDSTPPGARVTLDGKALGVTPLLTSIPCRPGDGLALELSLQGHRPQKRQVRCREDTLVSLTVPLPR